MAEPATDLQRRSRAAFGLTALTLLALTGVACVAALVLSHGLTADQRPILSPPAGLGTALDAERGWDVEAENRLATQPMAALPAQAAQPQQMTTETAGAPLSLPSAGAVIGQWIPGRFPATSEGALAQLRALDEAALQGGDPATYARGYRNLSLPGAPAPQATGLYSLLASMRSSATLAPDGPVSDLNIHYQATHGQIKGTTDGGLYVVACVLGQLSVDYRGQTVTAGVGDCEALRRDKDEWRISPGVLPAPAPSAWPGSRDAVSAGYRELM